MSDEELKSELDRLRNENAAVKKGVSTGIRMKVSQKGAISIYGMARAQKSNPTSRAHDF
jgi:hypothetical protein